MRPALRSAKGRRRTSSSRAASDVTADDYKRMIGNKTAEAFRCALEIGSAFAGGSAEQGRLLGEAAYEMGIAFQIHDDVLDIWGGEIIGKETALWISGTARRACLLYLRPHTGGLTGG